MLLLYRPYHIGHNYIGHNYICYNYIGHTCVGGATVVHSLKGCGRAGTVAAAAGHHALGLCRPVSDVDACRRQVRQQVASLYRP